MPQAAQAALVGVLVFGTAVWVGGFVAITLVTRVAGQTIGPRERVVFFRGLGRAYGIVGTIALAIALAAGAVLVSGHPWDGLLTTTVVIAALLVMATVTGMAQARRMTRLRRGALGDPGNAQLAAGVRRGARNAAVLRTLIGIFSLALIALGALLAT